MKKTFLIALVFLVGSSYAQAQKMDTTGKQSFYYYPQENVYFSPKNNSYFYYDSSGTSWKNVNQLPGNYNINSETKKNQIYYDGNDVWKNNAADIKQFGKPETPGTPHATVPKQ